MDEFEGGKLGEWRYNMRWSCQEILTPWVVNILGGGIRYTLFSYKRV